MVRLYLPYERVSQEHSLAQIASTRQAGCSVGGYVWAYPDVDARQTARDALALAAQANLRLRVLWFDVETYEGRAGPGVPWLRAAADECEQQGVQAGIYTGLWYVNAYLQDAGQLADLPLWLADYTAASIDTLPLPTGWTRAAGWQWQGVGIDRDVFREEVTRYT